MTETELLKLLKEFKEVKPSKNWVNLNKKQLLGSTESRFEFFPYFKPAFAGLIVIMFFFGTFGFSQYSLPGDILYPFKKIVEKGQAVFVSQDEKSVFQLKLANEKLEDLVRAPVRNLGPTIDEFEVNIITAARNMVEIDATTSDPVVIQKIVEQTKKLEENKQKMEVLGVVLGEQGTFELDNALAKILSNLIEDLEKRTLTEEKQEVLTQMKELFENGKYSEALELYLINQ